MKCIPILLCLILSAGLIHAADPSPAEARMREQLRAVMLQLRTAETERATLQATQAENEQKVAAMTEEVEAMKKKAADDKAAADKTVEELNTKLAKEETENIRLEKSLQEWKGGFEKLTGEYKKVAELANAKEAQRAKLAGEVIVLQRRVADQQTKNVALYNIGNEILTRYAKFGLGQALSAREPFVGITRVKLENLIQTDKDRLLDNTIKP